VSLDGLLDAIDYVEHCIGQPLGGRAIRWLRRERDKRVANAAH
jgi:hydroxymethylglutaryl-CoA lyase